MLGCSADAVAPEPEGGTPRAIFRRAVRERIRRRVRDAHLAQAPDAHPYEPYERSDFGFVHEWLVEHPELMLLIPLGLTGLAILVAALVSR